MCCDAYFRVKTDRLIRAVDKRVRIECVVESW